MGWNSTVVVMNDALHSIKDDPTFGKNLADAITHLSVLDRGDHVDVRALSHVNAATVIEQHHADSSHVVLVGGNIGTDLGHVGSWKATPETDDGKIAILRNLASNFGFDISIRKKK